MPYLLQDTSTGGKTLMYRGERDVRIHSAFDPVKEAARAAASHDPGKKEFIIVLGLGLGYHIAALREKFPDKRIIAVENDREVLKIAKKEYPDFIAGIQILFTTDDLSSVFENFDISSFKGFAVFTHRPSYSLYPAFYDNFIVDMNRYVSSKISDLLTRFEFEEKWAINILKNLPHLSSGACAQDFFGKFQGYPGIIVSAGPSLKKNVKLLASLSDRALIACVDTSFRVMERSGISPHIVMALDAQKHSIRHFLGINDTKPYLLADLVSCPKIADGYKGNIIISTTTKYFNDDKGRVSRETTPLMDWVEKYIPGIGDVQSGGSVATSLFDFMLNAGCDPIILVGQDLAYSGREIHTSGTYHNDEWLTMTNRTLNLDTINQRVVRKRKIKYVKGWGGKGEVITDFVMDLYRQWFEDSCGKVAVRVINATEGGAQISTADEIPLMQAAAVLKERKQTPADILEKIYTSRRKKNPSSFIAAAERALSVLMPLAAYEGRDISQQTLDDARIALADPDCAMIFSPFLKKTNAYLNRHPDIDEARAFQLITKDLIRASAVLVRLIPECCLNMKEKYNA